RSVTVDETIEKNGRVFFRCHVEETLRQRALDIPSWMFDSACRNMFTFGIPAVNCEALRTVKLLLSASRDDPTVKEGTEHSTRYEEGKPRRASRRKARNQWLKPSVRIDCETLRKGERLIESCEGCNPEGAEIPFDNILDRVTGSDPNVTDYVLEVPAKCPNC